MTVFIMLIGMLFLLQSCTYAISPPIADKTDKAITFEMLQSDPNSYKGSLVIFGGTIKQTTMMSQGMLFDVLQKPLDYWGRPIRTNRSSGHFIVYFPAFANPDSYAQGREITVAGEVAGTRLQKIEHTDYTGFTEYDCPVLISKELKLWPKTLDPELPQSWDPLSDPFASPRQGY